MLKHPLITPPLFPPSPLLPSLSPLSSLRPPPSLPLSLYPAATLTTATTGVETPITTQEDMLDASPTNTVAEGSTTVAETSNTEAEGSTTVAETSNTEAEKSTETSNTEAENSTATSYDTEAEYSTEVAETSTVAAVQTRGKLRNGDEKGSGLLILKIVLPVGLVLVCILAFVGCLTLHYSIAL